MQINFVQQKCGSSCGIAVASMATGVDFDTVLEWSGQAGISDRKLDELLTKGGADFVRHSYPEIEPESVYIVVVPSLNKRAVQHYIIVDTREESLESGEWGKVYDPVTGREGKEFYTASDLKSWSAIVEIKGNKAA